MSTGNSERHEIVIPCISVDSVKFIFVNDLQSPLIINIINIISGDWRLVVKREWRRHISLPTNEGVGDIEGCNQEVTIDIWAETRWSAMTS